MIQRVGIWVRVSPSKEESDSPEHHLHRAMAYATSRGWQATHIYKLEGVSGKVVHDHPDMRRMLADIESGEIQGLIFSSLARLARKKSTLEKISETFKRHGAAMVCLDQGFDTSTPAGELFYSILAAIVEFEGAIISERVIASVPIRAALGKRVGGPRPYGYIWTEQGLQLHPEEAPIRALIFELYREHRRFARVAKILNERGFKTARDAKWSTQTVRYFITDPFSKGVKRSNYTVSKFRQELTGNAYKSEDQWVYADIPAIVSEELWDECNQIANTKKQSRPKTSFAFSGLITCGHCGQKMYRDSEGQQGLQTLKYRCKNKCGSPIAESTLDKLFNQHLQIFLNDTSGMDSHLAKLGAELKAQQTIYNKQKLGGSKSAEKLRKIETDYFDGKLGPEAYERLTKGVEDSDRQLALGLKNTQSVINDLQEQIESAGVVTEAMGQAALKWDELDAKAKNEVGRAIIRKMSFKDGELDIDLLLPLGNKSFLLLFSCV